VEGLIVSQIDKGKPQPTYQDDGAVLVVVPVYDTTGGEIRRETHEIKKLKRGR
jgi:hypothetical protein